MAAARARLADPASGGRVPVTLYDRGELVTVLGLITYGPALMAMTRLNPIQRETGTLFGAMVEELQCSGLGGMDLLGLGSGATPSGPEAAVTRRLRFRDMIAAAVVALDRLPPLAPGHRGRPAEGGAALGSPHRALPQAGALADPRRPVPARRLVEHVCIAQQSVEGVLRGHGWARSADGRVSDRARTRAVQHLALGLDAVAVAWYGEVAPLPRAQRHTARTATEADPSPFGGPHKGD